MAIQRQKTDTRGRIAAIILAAFLTPNASGQDVVPRAENIQVVPAVAYEPAHPKPNANSGIVQAGFLPPVDDVVTPPTLDFNAPAPWRPRCWVAADLIAWRITPGPIVAPLVTSATPPAVGAINEPGTVILFGAGSGQNANFGTLFGGRLTIGGWLEQYHEHAWEGSGFGTGRQSFVFSAESPGGTAANLAIPFNATQPFGINPAGETALNSGGAPTNATVLLTSQMWGMELNQLFYLSSSSRHYLAGLVGFRYFALNENLTLTHTTIDSINNGTIAVTDGFNARNQFYSGQVGLRFGWSRERLTIESGSVIAFGANHQVLSIAGATTVNNGAFGFADGTTPGGVFAQNSNIGTISRDPFAVLPEFYLKANFAFTERFSAYLGYNVLYLSDVARPGSQIDRNVNPTQNAFFVPPGTLTGTAAPLPAFHSNSLWAYGLTFGIEFHF